MGTLALPKGKAGYVTRSLNSYAAFLNVVRNGGMLYLWADNSHREALR